MSGFNFVVTEHDQDPHGYMYCVNYESIWDEMLLTEVTIEIAVEHNQWENLVIFYLDGDQVDEMVEEMDKCNHLREYQKVIRTFSRERIATKDTEFYTQKTG